MALTSSFLWKLTAHLSRVRGGSRSLAHGGQESWALNWQLVFALGWATAALGTALRTGRSAYLPNWCSGE